MKISPNLKDGSVCDKANLDDTVISQLGKRNKKWALMLGNDSRQLTEAAQHHLKELLKDEETSDYCL